MALAESIDRIDRLEQEVQLHIKRTAAMQAEIDHLRAQRQLVHNLPVIMGFYSSSLRCMTSNSFQSYSS
jgi:hypothetical protein